MCQHAEWRAHRGFGAFSTLRGRESLHQDESRDLLDVIDEHLRVVRRVMKASEQEAEEDQVSAHVHARAFVLPIVMHGAL